MLIAIILMGLLFIGIAFIVTESNAKYLLSGYNTMDEKERENFDILSYVPYFRKFHLTLGLILLVIPLFLYYQINSDWAFLFSGAFPIIAYAFLIWKSNQFYKEKTKKQKSISIIAIVVMSLLFFLIIFEFVKGLQDNEVIIHSSKIEITGEYGFEISITDLKSISLVDSLPEISQKINGFDLVTIKKGNFKTKNQEKVKLLINSDKKPFILFELKDGQKIFYSSKVKSNTAIFIDLNKKYQKGSR